MDALGRTPGNPLFIVAQKWLTGHPKGPAAAWQMNGAIQAMAESVIPGNRNLDCVDPQLAKNRSLFFTRNTIQEQYVSACLVDSFGFGQAGGQCLFINPDYFLSSLDKASFAGYASRLAARDQRIFQHRQNIYGGRTPWTPIKALGSNPHKDPFSKVVLDKGVRRESTFEEGSDSGLTFSPPARTAAGAPALTQSLTSAMQEGGAGKAMGIDAEPVREYAESVMARNFTKAEREDILKQDKAAGTARTATGLWAAKEAVVKALGNAGLTLGGASDPLIDIELCRKENGSLGVQLHGKVMEATQGLQITEVRVSLSYADGVAYAAAVIA
jgi:fatty acid synthase subunit alpha